MSEKRRRAMMIFLVVTNVPAALYASVWHQAGTISAMKHIAAIAKSETITHGGVLLATPCHQTPYYSHVHSEIRLTFLECDPRGADSADSTALDDSASFAADPDAFLSAAYGASPLNATTDATTCVIASSLAPSRVLLFDADARRAARWLSAWRFVLEKSFHHAHFEVDRELQREVYLYKRDDVDVDDACRAPVPAA
jgi:phosphatidylinositol glycan class B